MGWSKYIGLLILYYSLCIDVVQSELIVSLEPTTLSSLESLSLDKSSGEVTAAQYVPLLYPSSDQPQNNVRPSVIQPSLTESFSGREHINQATLNRSIFPSKTLNSAQDSYQTVGEYDMSKILGSPKTAHQKTSAIEITSSSPLSLTLQPIVSMFQPTISSKTSTQGMEPMISAGWSMYDTMIKTQDVQEIQSHASMTITSSAFSTQTIIMHNSKARKGSNSCHPGSCPLTTDVCTPLSGGRFHCSCRKVYMYNVPRS
uniref:Uncharacterized protein LOC111099784 n=1 Tax=Crassostrea virginica TaxID=6565 RepID=A0A8B8A661_CRAVI|nr:uncharacterized protein LOC111099784 [Crassostrea virginica]